MADRDEFEPIAEEWLLGRGLLRGTTDRASLAVLLRDLSVRAERRGAKRERERCARECERLMAWGSRYSPSDCARRIRALPDAGGEETKETP